MACWLIDWWPCLSRCCKSCSGVALAHIKTQHLILRLFCYIPNAQICQVRWFAFTKGIRECTDAYSTLESLCGAPESCVYFHCHQTCKLVLKATSRGSVQASCLRSRGLSAEPTTGQCSCFLSWLWSWFENTHILGFQEGHRAWLWTTIRK